MVVLGNERILTVFFDGEIPTCELVRADSEAATRMFAISRLTVNIGSPVSSRRFLWL